MPKRILVLSASVGAGHIRAAEAVELALRQLAPEAEIQNVDVLDLTNSTFRRLYAKLYVDLVNTAPQLLGFVYDMLDRPPSAQRKSDRLRLLIERLNLGRFLRLLHNNLPTLAFKLARLLDDPVRLQQMKANARRLGRPQAAFDIARAALTFT